MMEIPDYAPEILGPAMSNGAKRAAAMPFSGGELKKNRFPNLVLVANGAYIGKETHQTDQTASNWHDIQRVQGGHMRSVL